MKFVELKCPHCGGQIDLSNDREFATCIYCGRKMMVVNDEAKQIDESVKKTDLELESVRSAIVKGNIESAIDLIDKLSSSEGTKSHAHMLTAFVHLIGYDTTKKESKGLFNKLFGKSSKLDDFQMLDYAESSWRDAFSLLRNQYYLADYSNLIGVSLGRMFNDSRVDDAYCSLILKVLENINRFIANKFNIEFSSDFYYNVTIGCAGYISHANVDDEVVDFLLSTMIESVRAEPNPDVFISRCSEYQNAIAVFGYEEATEDINCTIGVLGYTVSVLRESIDDDGLGSILSEWTESTLERKTRLDWENIVQCIDYCTEDGFQLSYNEMREMIDQMVDRYYGYDDSEDDYDEDDNEVIMLMNIFNFACVYLMIETDDDESDDQA